MSPLSPVTAHTPTPWKAEENCFGVYPISARQGPICVQPAKAFGEADAAFIVRAVNNFEAMARALEAILEGYGPQHGSKYCRNVAENALEALHSPEEK